MDLKKKMNKLKQKSARCNSYKEFLSKFIKENLVSKGIESALHRNRPLKKLAKTLSANGYQS